MKLILRGCTLIFFSFVGMNGASAEPIDVSKLADGWVMHFFPIQDTNKPENSDGRSLATLLYKGGFPVGYRDAFEIEPELSKYNDRYWLIKYDGFLNLPEDGPYTFALNYSWSNDANCGASLDIEGNQLVKLPLTVNMVRAPRNAYVDRQLKAGLYRTNLKMFCLDIRSSSAVPQLELAIRGPSDGKPVPVDSSMMKYLRP